jgi:uncharacterized protein (TIGR02646 family)
MLHINFQSTYKFSKKENAQLLLLRKKYGRNFQNAIGKNKTMVWYDGEKATKEIKNNISRNGLNQSKFRCCYCEKSLINETKPIDHFIPNKAYPHYSFHPLNLLQSCSYCNSDLKGEFDPIVTPHKKYKNIVFSIVHPIIDNVNTHFAYETIDQINYDIFNCSAKAKETIRLFNWDSFEHLEHRSSIKTLELFHQITDDSLLKLVNECSTYQPKKKK